MFFVRLCRLFVIGEVNFSIAGRSATTWRLPDLCCTSYRRAPFFGCPHFLITQHAPDKESSWLFNLGLAAVYSSHLKVTAGSTLFTTFCDRCCRPDAAQVIYSCWCCCCRYGRLNNSSATKSGLLNFAIAIDIFLLWYLLRVYHACGTSDKTPNSPLVEWFFFLLLCCILWYLVWGLCDYACTKNTTLCSARY